tara:strand:+ start:4190 stop:5650 length:1461 start_codon:yes stop_codon:yes gene_type:complete
MSRNHNDNKDNNKKNIINKKNDCSNNSISPLIINKKNNNRKLFLLDISNNKKQDNLLLFTTNKYNKQTDLNKDNIFNITMPETKYNKSKTTNPYYNRLINHLDNTKKYQNVNDKKKSLHFLLEDVDRKYGKQYTKESTIHDYWNSTNNYTPMKQLKIPPKIELKKTFVEVKADIETLEDLIKLSTKYPLDSAIEYSIDIASIHNIVKPLTELNNMIGMKNLKQSILDQIIYFIQNLHVNNSDKNSDFMHVVIYGPPGTGKTETAKLMGKIFSKMGVLKKNTFKKVTRADLIAGYLGQTAIKTKEVIKNSLGGVLFIDEAYALGNTEKRDSFAKECIDTLCEGLSDHKNNLMVIIAGYEEELNKCFFAYNQGLDSRFTWRYNTDSYDCHELNLIFSKKLKDIGWTFKEKIPDSWFEDKMDYFKYFGRDMETLLAKVKIAHGRRVFCKKKSVKKQVSLKDMNNGFKLYLNNNEVQSRKKENYFSNMYV